MLRFLCVLFCLLCSLTIASSAPLIKRIAIVGSGTAGLGLAAALKQLPSGVEEVVIFEGRDDFLQPSLGGGVQINGGAAVMEKLGCLPDLERVAQRMGAVRSRNNYGTELLQLDIFTSVLTKAKDELCDSSGTGAPMVFSIMRDALQSILYDATQNTKLSLPNSDAGTPLNTPQVRVCGSMRCVSAKEDSGKVILTFADGRTESGFDVVFGADGVGSSLRQYTSGGDQSLLDPLKEWYQGNNGSPPGPSSTSSSDVVVKTKNAHTGLRITYAVTPPDDSFALRPDGKNIFHQWFGNGCYALSASYGGLKGVQHMVALVYRDDREEENQAWAEEEAAKGPRNMLLERLRKGKLADNEELLTLVNACEETRFVDLGVRDRTVPLLSWAADSGRIILLGDSAHAMAPFLGQGANQALQDAYFLAQGICAINAKDSVQTAVTVASDAQRAGLALRQLARSFEWKRKLPTALIAGKAKILGTIETAPGPLGGVARDLFFYAMGKLGVAEYVYLDGARPKPMI